MSKTTDKFREKYEHLNEDTLLECCDEDFELVKEILLDTDNTRLVRECALEAIEEFTVRRTLSES